jgi:hypothetical protein
MQIAIRQSHGDCVERPSGRQHNCLPLDNAAQRGTARASGNDMLDDSVLALPCFVCSTVGAKSLDLDSTLLVERLRVRKLRWDALSLPFHPHCRGA